MAVLCGMLFMLSNAYAERRKQAHHVCRYAE
jgi:hypothetical protein